MSGQNTISTLFDLQVWIDQTLDLALKTPMVDKSLYPFFDLLTKKVGSENQNSLHLPLGDPIKGFQVWPKGDPRPSQTLNLSQWEVFPTRYAVPDIVIDPDDLRRDKAGLGWLTDQINMLVAQTELHPYEMELAAIVLACTTTGFDGLPLFSTVHPLTGGTTMSNLDNGNGGHTWFLGACNYPMVKPFLDWVELTYKFTDISADLKTIMFQEPVHWGVHGWRNILPGYWATVYASNATITKAHVNTVRAAMTNRVNPISGHLYGYRPSHLFYDPADTVEALAVCQGDLMFETSGVGGTNVLKGTLIPIAIPNLNSLALG